MMNNTTEGQVRTALVQGRKLARSEFARVLLMVHRAQQAENLSCGAHGPACVVFEFEYGSREAEAIGGMRGRVELARNLSIVDDEERGVVRVNR